MTNFNGRTRRMLAIAGFGALMVAAQSANAQQPSAQQSAHDAAFAAMLSTPVAGAVADPFAINTMDTDPTKDEVVFDVDDSVPNSEIIALAAECGLTARLNSPYSDEANLFIADVAEGAVPQYVACLREKTSGDWLEAAEENLEYVLLGTPPNDPLYQFQWNFKQVNAEEAWETSTGKDVVVAVIDTGVAVESDSSRNIIAAKDLAGTKTVKGYDFVDNDAFAWDGHGHGTHVAGTIAQTTGNKYGVAGLAYNAKIMPLRVLNSRGFGQVSDIADAIRFAADNGAQVINMSLGGPLPSLVMKKAIDHAYKKGVTTVAAAGNGGKRAASYPAAYDHVIAVAATQYDKSTTFYSQWGKFVDIAAPGGNTRVDQNRDGRPDGVMQETLKDSRTDEHDFLLYMGTSMASPHVAAGAALVIAQGVTHPDRVEEVLQKSADDSQKDRYDDKEYTERYGAGIMQADKAAKNAAGEQGGLRLAMTFLLGLVAFGRLRRKDMLGFAPAATPGFVGAAVVASSGLFLLPMFLGDAGFVGSIVNVIGRPLPELDAALLGFGYHQNPLLASALIPLAAVLTLGGSKRWKFVGAGLALGFAGFCLTEAFLLTSDVRWIPGMDLLDRAWLAVNGVFSFVLGYLALKRY